MPASTFLLIGAPATGKSSTSRALAERFDRGLHLPVDDLRNMVVAGLVLPGEAWPDVLVQQVALARRAALDVAATYTSAGFTVVIDDFYDRLGLVEYRPLAARPDVHRVILHPTQDVAHRRNILRNGHDPAVDYIGDGIRQVYGWLEPRLDDLAAEGWLILDTSDLDVAASVDAILAFARDRRAPVSA